MKERDQVKLKAIGVILHLRRSTRKRVNAYLDGVDNLEDSPALREALDWAILKVKEDGE